MSRGGQEKRQGIHLKVRVYEPGLEYGLEIRSGNARLWRK